jgi:hypothetical protein
MLYDDRLTDDLRIICEKLPKNGAFSHGKAAYRIEGISLVRRTNILRHTSFRSVPQEDSFCQQLARNGSLWCY